MGWRSRAGCLGLDHRQFFPPRGVVPVDALQVCADCPVRRACLGEALAEMGASEDAGVRGGTTANGRSKIRRGQLTATEAMDQADRLATDRAQAHPTDRRAARRGDP